MIKRNFTAALIAAGMLAIASVAQATVVDLIHNDSGTITNQYGTAIFQWIDPHGTGTGIVDPFLRIQNSPSEQGYNTSGSPVPFDDKVGPWTHDVQFSALQNTAVTLNGQVYFTIVVDLNESNGSNSTISLDKLQFYSSATGGATTENLSLLGTLRYALGTGNQVLFDAGRNSGSGSGDALMYIPASAFVGTNPNDFIYMYVAMGLDPNYTSSGGFEEFGLVTPVPELSALFPIVGLLVAVGSTHVLRRRRMARVSS
jgi:hypothetical protein